MVELKNAKFFDYVRFVLSALILLFSAVVTSYAIVERKTGFWHIVPGWAALILFVVDLFLLGIVEGLQIALVELKRQHPDSYKNSHPAAYRIGQVAARGDNVERFLMGRQVFVVFLVFFAAKLTTITLEEKEGFLFPAPFWFRSVFLETGILACIVVVIIAQLMPQIVAAKYPVHFLQFFIMKPAYYTCVFVEITGLTHICWVLSHLLGYVAGMRDDEITPSKEKLPSEGNADDLLESLGESLDAVKVEGGSTNDSGLAEEDNVPKEKQMRSLLDISVTAMGQVQYSRFSHLVETINQHLDPATLTVVKHYLDSHPEKFHQFPTVVGNAMYPSPQSIAEEISKEGQEVPKFLTDISSPEHIPPHIVACELLAQNRVLKEELMALRRQQGNRKGDGNNTRL